jgi:dephospho-CoA kinase
MKIVVVAGFAGAGKDTFANVLCKHKGYRRFAFADPIKEMIAEEHNVPLEWLHSPVGKQKVVNGKTLRQYCIDLGESERKKDPEVWGKRIAQQIKESNCQRVVISDWRLLPELFALQKAFPEAFLVPIRIQRSYQYISSVPDMTEYSLMGFPYAFTIQNSGISEEELLDQINLLPL